MRRPLVLAATAAAIAAVALRWRRRRARADAPSTPGDRPTAAEAVATPVDFTQAFRAGARFGDREVRIERVAMLHMQTGQVVACDPMVSPDQVPLDRTVPPGIYPVDASVITDPPRDARVACLRLVVSPEPPVTWVAAGRYGVDAGLGCFMDAETAGRLRRAMGELPDGESYYDHVLYGELGDRRWLDHRLAPRQPHNVAIVVSGWGDGVYDSYWGLDAAGRPAWLVSDFELLR